MRSPSPSQCRHDDAITRATLDAVFLDTSFGLFVNLRTIRHGEPFGSIAGVKTARKAEQVGGRLWRYSPGRSTLWAGLAALIIAV
jgi:hypothetical protein